MEFYKINSDEKIELHIGYDKYKSLPKEDQKDIKSYFLFSRGKEAWISKGKHTGYWVKKIVDKLGFPLEGKDEKKSFIEKIKEEENKSEYYKKTSDKSIAIKDKPFSERQNTSYTNATGFFQKDLNKYYNQSVEWAKEYIKDEIDIDNPEEYPDYIKTALERYLKKVEDHWTKRLSIATYAPSMMVTGPSNYPVHRLAKAHNREGKNFELMNEAEANFKNAISKVSRVDSKYNEGYLANRIKESEARHRLLKRRLFEYPNEKERWESGIKEEEEKIEFYRDKLISLGVKRFDKESLKGAEYIKYNNLWYKVIRLNNTSVTHSWFVGTWKVPYAKIVDAIYEVDKYNVKPNQSNTAFIVTDIERESGKEKETIDKSKESIVIIRRSVEPINDNSLIKLEKFLRQYQGRYIYIKSNHIFARFNGSSIDELLHKIDSLKICCLYQIEEIISNGKLDREEPPKNNRKNKFVINVLWYITKVKFDNAIYPFFFNVKVMNDGERIYSGHLITNKSL